MVSSIYTPNRKIDYYRKLAQALQPKKMMAFDPRLAAQNPYAQTTATNLANVLSGLVQTYSAEQQLGKAEQLEAEQLAAQGDIFSALTEARQPTTGAPLDVQGGQFMRVPYRRRAVDISPETLKTAGTTKQAIASEVSSINKAAKAAYTDRQNAAIDAAIVKAYQDGNEEAVAALRLLRDPMKATKPEKPGKPVFTAFSGELGEVGEGVQAFPDGRLVIWRRNKAGNLIPQTVTPPSEESEVSAPVTKNGEQVEEAQKENEFRTQAERLAEKELVKKGASLRAQAKESWPKLVAKRRKLQQETKSLIKSATDAKELIIANSKVTGLGGFFLKDLPTTDARKLRNILNKIKAYAGFSTLEGMRNAAPSGASGLGALSQQEMELLIAKTFTGDQEMAGWDLIKAINDLVEDAQRTLEIGEEMHNNIASTFNLTVDKKPAVPTEEVLQTPVDDLINKYKKR